MRDNLSLKVMNKKNKKGRFQLIINHKKETKLNWSVL